MATTTILHIGEDLCQRSPVMETVGLVVVQTEIDIPAIRRAFDDGHTFSSVVFQSDISSPPQPTVRETRRLTEAPFVLFQNPAVICDEDEFNLVVPPLTPPAVWLQKLVQLIEDSRRLCRESAQLRRDCAAIRSSSEVLRANSARNRVLPVDPEALWNGEPGAKPEPKPPQESRPENGAAKRG